MDFSNTTLYGCDFDGTKLKNTILNGANITNSNLTYKQLKVTNFLDLFVCSEPGHANDFKEQKAKIVKANKTVHKNVKRCIEIRQANGKDEDVMNWLWSKNKKYIFSQVEYFQKHGFFMGENYDTGPETKKQSNNNFNM